MYSTKSVAVTQEETNQQQTKLYFTARKPKCRRLPEIRLLILYTSQNVSSRASYRLPETWSLILHSSKDYSTISSSFHFCLPKHKRFLIFQSLMLNEDQEWFCSAKERPFSPFAFAIKLMMTMSSLFWPFGYAVTKCSSGSHAKVVKWLLEAVKCDSCKLYSRRRLSGPVQVLLDPFSW